MNRSYWIVCFVSILRVCFFFLLILCTRCNILVHIHTHTRISNAFWLSSFPRTRYSVLPLVSEIFNILSPIQRSSSLIETVEFVKSIPNRYFFFFFKIVILTYWWHAVRYTHFHFTQIVLSQLGFLLFSEKSSKLLAKKHKHQLKRKDKNGRKDTQRENGSTTFWMRWFFTISG